MSSARYLIGDVFDVMGTMPDGSVDLVLTSPPFLALRSYLPADHPDKSREIGSEPTPAEFIDTLLALTAEWGRLLAPHGSIAVELGDTYAGGGNGPDKRYDGAQHEDNTAVRFIGTREGWPLDKSLCGIPHLYHLSLAYGRNLLTGQPSPAGQWRVRNVVAWCRPNPAVGALGDKFRPATSYMTIATKARDRWFDLDAVRTPYSPNTNARVAKGVESQDRSGKSAERDGNWASLPEQNNNGAGAPPLDWWEIPTEAYPGSHYATWPRKLLDRPIAAMCPKEVCTTCGQPRRRIAETTNAVGHAVGRAAWTDDAATANLMRTGPTTVNASDRSVPDYAERVTLGWTDCGHNTYRRGHVLDPFGGSGTTAVVATGHGRDCTLIDLDERNADLARERVGMFLEVTERKGAA